MRFNRTLPSALLAALILAACGGGDDAPVAPVAPTAPVVQGTVVTAAQMNDIDLNAIFAAAKEGDTVTLPPGKYSFKGPLQITNKKKITVLGAGNGTDPTSNTILSFAKALAQNGIDAANLDTVTFKKFAIEDASGNGVFVNQSKNIVMDTLRTEWMINPFGTSKMVYGLYPVSSDNVKIVNSKAVGTRDAGVYVGQSTNILVAKNTVVNNVAGIEIENSYNAIVEDNDVYDNTGGILVFALKAPPRFKTTENVVVRNNRITDNNTPPFVNASGLVLTIPPGTGVMVLASQNVDIYGNTITDHKTTGVLLISAYAAGEDTNSPVKGTGDNVPYDNFGKGNYVHNNTITNFGYAPGGAFAIPGSAGGLKEFTDQFMAGYKSFPAVLWDGIVDPNPAVSSGVDVSTGYPLGGNYTGNYKVCSKANSVTPPAAAVVPDYQNLDLNLFGLLTQTSSFYFYPTPPRMNCTITLPPVTGYPS
jgi:parallel beta-helix repeat protein